MSLDADLLAAIDARIAAAAVRVATTGTITSITGDNDALVTFDGSTLAIPVKLAGDANFTSGDRVLLVRTSTWWVAVVPLTRRWLSIAGANADQSAIGTTTSGAGVDVPNPVNCTFTKRWDDTYVLVETTVGAWSSGAGNTQATFGANFTSVAQGTIPTYSTSKLFFNNASEHLSMRSSRIITDLVADTYTVAVYWSRTAGTGVVTADANDACGIVVTEIAS